MTENRRLASAAALRALNHAFVAHDADDGALEAISAFATTMLVTLLSGRRRDRSAMLSAHVGQMFAMDARDPGRRAANPMADRAVGGPANPLAAEFDVEYETNEVVVRTVLGAAYEGAPGRAHGGMVAALFDDITGFVLPLVGTPAYTGRLTVHYHRPVPIEVPLEFRTSIRSRDGRKLHAEARCTADGERVATADVLFITVDGGQFGRSPA